MDDISTMLSWTSEGRMRDGKTEPGGRRRGKIIHWRVEEIVVRYRVLGDEVQYHEK